MTLFLDDVINQELKVLIQVWLLISTKRVYEIEIILIKEYREK
jgi:hypothetical protein